MMELSVAVFEGSKLTGLGQPVHFIRPKGGVSLNMVYLLLN